MDRIRPLVPMVLACCAAFASLPASAQGEPANGKRQKVDVRAMAPAPRASDAVADARPAGALTRDQRREATLQAREDGTLRPAGEASDLRDAKAGTLTSAADSSSTVPSMSVAAGEAALPPTQVAVATSAPVKKAKVRKARPPAVSAPI